MAEPATPLPRISVVVPSYNQGNFLREALDSIFRQEYPHLEVVVMDGGSTDDSVAIIRSNADRLKHWQSQQDGGQSEAINAGMRHCSGDLVAWLNSDDYYCGHALWNVGRAYAAYPRQGLYIGNGLRYDQRTGRYTPFLPRHVALKRSALRDGPDYLLQPSTFFLREAWENAGGLDPKLRFCMDWDIFLRIAQCYPAVVLNEFLAVSREYEETKTRSGKIKRAIEIIQMIQGHTGTELTPGSLHYLLDTLAEVTREQLPAKMQIHLHQAMGVTNGVFCSDFGGGLWCPEQGDAQDQVYLPFARAGMAHPGRAATAPPLPALSVVVPSLNQRHELEQTLESLCHQDYPNLEILVIDGGSTDLTVELLKRYAGRVAYEACAPEHGLAHALNQGLGSARGEVLAWLYPGDLLAAGALRAAGEAFAQDPGLDLVYGNAVFINTEDQLCLTDLGSYYSGFWIGELEQGASRTGSGPDVSAFPQPTICFRRGLWRRCGRLDESFRYFADFELFLRLAERARIQKLERTQALCRVRSPHPPDRKEEMLGEAHRLLRMPRPALASSEVLAERRQWIERFMRRFAARALDQVLPWEAPPVEAERNPPVPLGPVVARRQGTFYQSLYCGRRLPSYPGQSGREAREFLILRHLLRLSTIEFFAPGACLSQQQGSAPSLDVDVLHTPEVDLGRGHGPVRLPVLRPKLATRLASWLRRWHIPVPGPQNPLQVTEQFAPLHGFCRQAIQDRLDSIPLDFLFVSDQTNPLAFTLKTKKVNTRLVLISSERPAERLRQAAAGRCGLFRVALDWEAQRAQQFEEDNLAYYDAIIAASECERDGYVKDYEFPAERVAVIGKGVDLDYWSALPRRPGERPAIVFVGNLEISSNRQAACRLLDSILPLVRRRYPQVCCWVINPGKAVRLPGCRTWRPDSRTRLLHQVDDVRPHLAQTAVACLPLASGHTLDSALMETLAAGVPVVCPPLVSADVGLTTDRHLLTGQDDEQMAAALVRLLQKPAQAEQLGKAGQSQVAQRHSAAAQLAGLADWLAELAVLPRLRVQRAMAPACAPSSLGGRPRAFKAA
jgi:glycosyltransferase involved in cell wall biosynthesis